MIEWNPTVATILGGSKELGKIPLIITPYCKSSALEELLDAGATTENFELVVRFSAREISQGATDLDIYDQLNQKGFKLYAHPSIHLKLYLFGPGKAFLTSANLTQRGLGISKSRNVETGTFVDLEQRDWIEINQLLDASRLVTADLVDQLKKYQYEPEKMQEILDKFYSEGGLSLMDLPALPKPEDFINEFKGDTKLSGESLQRYLCDYATYRGDLIPKGEDPTTMLKEAFLSKPFIKAFCTHLKNKESMRFGEATSWFHDNISERPLPYRSEIKGIVSRIYNWITFFKEEASWSIPGQHSQVIQWANGKKATHFLNPPWSQKEHL